MKEVKYRQYRDYLQQRISTNDTMMGLLVGSKLASQTLTLTTGSRLRLKDIFPKVPHIERLNLTTEKAQDVLDNAEHLLGVLAVPQIMALHEDLMVGMLGLLEQNIPGSTRPKKQSLPRISTVSSSWPQRRLSVLSCFSCLTASVWREMNTYITAG